MDVEIKHSPAFAVARLKLAAGEVANVEAGAMYQQSSGIVVESKMEGGLFGAAKRALLSGDSFFVSKFSAPQGGWVDVVPNLAGDVIVADIGPSSPLILTKGVWLASDTTVNLDAKFGNAGTFFGGEGAFLVKATGHGKIVMAAYGAMDVSSLAAGETITVDTGHLVAYEDTCNVRIRKIAKGIFGSIKSGEGLVMDITGPGDVITQTRNPKAFASWITSLMPSSGGSGGGFSIGG